MRVALRLLLSCVAWGSAQGALGVPELEPNDSFAERQLLAPGELSLEAALADVFDGFDESRAGVLAEGAVDSYTIVGATPSVPFTAWIDNLIVDPFPDDDPDTVLGAFDTLGVLLDSNDDSSPLGSLASALGGTVNPDGTIRLKVTGWPDFDFDGRDDGFPEDPHIERGSYILYVRIGEAPDVDYVTFTGLGPGTFDAEIVASEFDTVMGRFDDAGAQIDFDDDGGAGTRSRLMGDIPPSGELHLAVGTYFDPDLDGEIDTGSYAVGSYELVVTVPEPGTPWLTAALAAASGLAGLRRARGGSGLYSPVEAEEKP